MKYILSVLLLAVVLQVSGQEKTHYLMDGDASIGGFGGVILEGGSLNAEPSLFVGGGGGALFNNRFFFGGYGMGNVTNGANFNQNDTAYQIDLGHGGLWIGYVIMPEKVVHLSASCRLGWGGVDIKDDRNNLLFSDDIIVVTPQAAVEANVARFMKINLGIGYRATFGVNNHLFDSSDLSSPVATLGVYFGWF